MCCLCPYAHHQWTKTLSWMHHHLWLGSLDCTQEKSDMPLISLTFCVFRNWEFAFCDRKPEALDFSLLRFLYFLQLVKMRIRMVKAMTFNCLWSCLDLLTDFTIFDVEIGCFDVFDMWAAKVAKMFYTFQLDQVASYRIVSSQVSICFHWSCALGFMSLVNV